MPFNPLKRLKDYTKETYADNHTSSSSKNEEYRVTKRNGETKKHIKYQPRPANRFPDKDGKDRNHGKERKGNLAIRVIWVEPKQVVRAIIPWQINIYHPIYLFLPSHSHLPWRQHLYLPSPLPLPLSYNTRTYQSNKSPFPMRNPFKALSEYTKRMYMENHTNVVEEYDEEGNLVGTWRSKKYSTAAASCFARDHQADNLSCNYDLNLSGPERKEAEQQRYFSLSGKCKFKIEPYAGTTSNLAFEKHAVGPNIYSEIAVAREGQEHGFLALDTVPSPTV
ncbi:hypothetical protein DL96DRAFT_1561861 [Flagelloscypha sp. PMI_526]|nr:hypothetical protein DL96DRAFT_1561861 [Flagelloscypha sp. PMI_526]